MMERLISPRGEATAIAVLVATSVAALWWSMSHGAGVSPDSVIYFGTAKSLLAGRGFWFDGTPMTHFPPGYPLLLASAALITGTVATAAKVLAALGLVISILLIAIATRSIDASARYSALIAVVLFLVSGQVVDVYAMAWTEPWFLILVLLGLLLLSRWMTQSRMMFLAIGALSFGLAIVMRYIGIVLVGPLVIAAIAVPGAPLLMRAKNLVIAGTCMFGPLALWVVRNRAVTSHATDRVVAQHLISAEQIQQFFTTVSDYFFPLPIGDAVKIFIVFAVAALIAWGLVRRTRMREFNQYPDQALLLLGTIFLLCYAAFLAISISYLDATTPLDDRILFPFFGVAIVLVVIAGSALYPSLSKQLRVAMIAMGIVSIGLRAPSVIDNVGTLHQNGAEYSSEVWKQSATLADVRALPATIAVYSNAQDAIQFLTDRPARWLPDSILWESMQANPAFPSERAAMCKAVLSGNAIVAHFNTEDPGDEWALNQTASLCAFPVMTRTADGAFYSAAPLASLPKP